MHICAQVFSVPKAGNSPEEYEDSFWPQCDIHEERQVFRFAVADGATEASFSGMWAWFLVRAYGLGDLSGRGFPRVLSLLQKEWLDRVSRRAQSLPWYAQEKLRYGAFSTLLGLTVKGMRSPARRSGTWHALAIGDSCLFHVREDKILRAFPLERADEFSSRPLLLSSSLAQNARLVESIRHRSGRWEVGDVMYLMTDALAQWFLRRHQEEGNAIPCLSDIGSSSQFTEFVDVERTQKDLQGIPWLRNDDVTMIRVKLS